MRLLRLAGAGTFLAALALVILGGGLDAAPSHSATANLIVFVSNRGTHQPGEIYLLTPGKAPRNITHSPSTDVGLAVSPVGDAIAFWSNRLGRYHLYLARSDGSHLRAVKHFVTSQLDITRALIFSRDGKRLFADVDAPGALPYGAPPAPIDTPAGTYVVDVAHSTAHQALPPLDCLNLSPSPDGRFISCFTDFTSATVYDIAGHARFTFATSREPAWSSRGLLVSSIGNSSIQDPSSSIVDESGRPVAQFRGSFCEWSRDGRQLVFARQGVVRIGNPRHLSQARVVPGATGCGPLVGDGRYFETSTGSGAPKLLPVSGGTPIRWPAPQDSDLSTGVWSGNNRLAFFTGIGTQGSALPGTQFAVHIRDLHGRGEIVGRFPVATVGSDVLYWLPNGRGVLLDASWEKRGSALYSVPASGGATRPFGTDPQPEGPPAWSRNGRTITYIGGNHIMTAGEDGTDPKIVLTESTGDEAPSFSPDETQIVFLQGVSTVFQIATVPASGGTPTVLAPSLTSDAPAWSPDGSTIADIVFDNTTSTLSLRWIEPASGQTVATLPTGIPWSLGQTGEISLAWSPDGTHIAITGESGIYVLPVSPRGAAQLAIPIPGAEDPSYSPDGTQIAFDAPIPSTGTQTAIMIANTDGTNARVLSTAPLTASDHPAWQPNP